MKIKWVSQKAYGLQQNYFLMEKEKFIENGVINNSANHREQGLVMVIFLTRIIILADPKFEPFQISFRENIF